MPFGDKLRKWWNYKNISKLVKIVHSTLMGQWQPEFIHWMITNYVCTYFSRHFSSLSKLISTRFLDPFLNAQVLVEVIVPAEKNKKYNIHKKIDYIFLITREKWSQKKSTIENNYMKDIRNPNRKIKNWFKYGGTQHRLQK